MKAFFMVIAVLFYGCGPITINQDQISDEPIANTEVIFEEGCDYVICYDSDTTAEQVSREEWFKRCEWECGLYRGEARFVSITWERVGSMCYMITSEWDTAPNLRSCDK